MKLSTLFTKDITRNIDWVIQVERTDSDVVRHELEEYVITKELDKHFRAFFDIVGKSEESSDVGIWISWFFGSGKSHFLKMLAYLIDNKPINWQYPIDFFQTKIADSLFFSDMKSIINRYNTDVILFNIDSKATANARNNKDAIVEVCIKAFFSHLWFLASKPRLAYQEWKLRKNNEYELFKQKYQERSWNSREVWRTDIDLEKQHAVQALIDVKWAGINEDDVYTWFDGPYQTKNYEISPEIFHDIISEYCQTKWKKNRIMFMIDEVWQYIGSNPELMLNLQTVTEELRTLGGKALIVVTSQEAIDKIAHMDGQAHFDFSKIKGRFKTQISLSSSNVDEVIKKRLLEKTKEANKELSWVYTEQEHHLKNILTFTPALDSAHYKNESDFIDLYPIVPYQIELTKETLHQIGNVWYAGNHLARWERSLLGIFQQAITQRKDDALWTLIPFDVVYDAISWFIPSYIKWIFNKAEENSHIKWGFTIRVLKILFLLKYVKNLSLTPDNITTLLIDNIDTNVIKLKEDVIKSLEKLKSQWFINKRADDYEFLSDEEQEIERDIAKIDVEDNEVYDFIYSYFFEEQYPGKFSYDKQHDYTFKRIIDAYEKVKSSDTGSLSLQIRTSWYDEPTETETLFWSYGVSITLNSTDEENNPNENIQQCLRIWKYIRRNNRDNSHNKRIQQKELEMETYKTKAKELLLKSAMIGTYRIGSNVQTVPGGTFREVCNNLLKISFDNIYTEFKTLPADLQNTTLENILRSQALQNRLLADQNELSWAHKKIIKTLEISHMRKVATTLTKIHEECMYIPYGRKESDINKLVAQLWVMKHIILKFESKEVQLDDGNAIEYLSKAHYKDKITLEVKQATDPLLVRKVADILRKIDSKDKQLNDALNSDDADQIKKTLFAWARTRQDFINTLLTNYQYKPYPWKKSLEDFSEWLDQIKWYETTKEIFEWLIKEELEILKITWDASLVQDFFGWKQKELRDSGYEILQMVDKITKLLSDESLKAYEQLKIIMNNSNPYDDIRKIWTLSKEIKDSYEQLVVESKVTINGKIDDHIKTTLWTFKDILWKDREAIELLVWEKKYLIDNLKNYADLVVEEQQLYDFFQSLQYKIDVYLVEHTSKQPAKEWTKGGKKAPTTAIPRVTSIRLSSLMKGSEKVSSKEDIDWLVDDIKKNLYKKLEDYDSITLLP